MRVLASSVGLLLLCTSACTFLDDLDQSIEKKADELTARVTPPAQPSPPSPVAQVQPPPSAPPAPLPQPAAPIGPSQITVGAASVHGEIPAKKARSIVDRHRNELRFCHESNATAPAHVKVAVKFVVSPEGAVQASGIEQSDTDDEQLQVCIVQAVRRWTFPAPTGGGIAVITIPIELSR